MTSTRRLVLAGGGHAHVHVCKHFRLHTIPGQQLTLVSPSPVSTYSGMVPGVVAGQYRLRDAQIDVRNLVEAAGGTFVANRVVSIDSARNRIVLASGEQLPYDVLSVDLGAHPRGGKHVVPDAPVIPLRPIELALHGLESALVASRGTPCSVLIVGGGPGGLELAFALHARLRNEKARITVCDTARAPLAGAGRHLSRHLAQAMEEKGIRFLGDTAVETVDTGGAHLSAGRRLSADILLWATGAAAPPLFAEGGLPVDARGFLRVEANLRCREAPCIFGTGDCIALASHPTLAKAGVHAVREGPILAENLAAALTGAEPRRTYQPHRRSLWLINTCDGSALFRYGRVALRGKWVWRLKDHIDRSFIERYTLPAAR